MDAAQARFGQSIFIQKQFTGRLLSPSGNWVDVGTNGQADLGGFIGSGPPRIAAPFQMEIKTGLATRSNAQISMAALYARIGVPYLLVDHDHVATAMLFLDATMKGLRFINEVKIPAFVDRPHDR